MMAIASVFTSCSKDDDSDPVVTDTFDHAQVTIDYEFSADQIDYFDMSLTVTDFDGASEVIKITQAGKGSKVCSTKNKNGKVSVNFTSNMKSSAALDATKERTFKSIVYYTSAVYHSNGKMSQVKSFSPGISADQTITQTVSEDVIFNALKTVFTCDYNNTFSLTNGEFVVK